MKWYPFILLLFIAVFSNAQNGEYKILADSPASIENDFFEKTLTGGDTIFIDSGRTKGITFNHFNGNENEPIVITFSKEKVKIIDNSSWAAIELRNCSYIKITGDGLPDNTAGLELSGRSAGLAVTELSTDVEIEKIKITNSGFAGIMVKKDYQGNPPVPNPVFEKLIIHDCYIENVDEGMYLGETRTPGMNFKHVKVFNNVIVNTRREGIQVANMIEDIEVYNNLLMNNGTDGIFAHGNNMQIGDNCVGSFHHNIMIGASEVGLIVFGSGDIDIHNNYISESEGMFIDHRLVTILGASINIYNNYFYNIIGDNVISIYNHLLPININNNFWNASGSFIKTNLEASNNVSSENNLNQPINAIIIEDNKVTENNPADFREMGIQENRSYILNYKPVLKAIGNHVFNWETDNLINIEASTPDSDFISFELNDSIDFSYLTDYGNGTAVIEINPKKTDQGIYYATIIAKDHSHQHRTRERFKIAIKDPNNRNPEIEQIGQVSYYNLQKSKTQINISDADGDEIKITTRNFPDFLEIVKEEVVGEAPGFFISSKAKYIDVGQYDSLLVVADDGYGNPDSVYFRLEILQSAIVSETPIYRINCGGPEIEDFNLNWEGTYYSRLPYEISSNHHTGSHSWSGTNNTGAPDNLFGPWCFDYEGGDEMIWAFDCDNGKYLVNLFFAENEAAITSIGPTISSIKIQNEMRAENFNIFQEAEYEALKKSFEVEVFNNKIEIEFLHVKNNPKLNGIEILFLSEHGTGLNKAIETTTRSAAQKVEIFPVPASDYINLKLSDFFKQERVTIEILNLHGEVVTSVSSPAFSENPVKLLLDRSTISGGIYIVRISSLSGVSENSTLIIR